MIAELASARSLFAAAVQRVGQGPATAYIGWSGHGNFGDDAMFDAAQSLLGHRLLVLRRAGIEMRLARIGLSGPALFDRALLGGGTLINRGCLPIVEACLELRLPLVALGTGVGSAGFQWSRRCPIPAGPRR